MAESKPLLVEIGCEELPPKSLGPLSEAFAEGLCRGLLERGVSLDRDHAKAYHSPRRLAVFVPRVAIAQPDRAIERRGPPLAAGRDPAGRPSPALLGFAASCGVAVDALETHTTEKGAWFVHRSVQRGRATVEVLPEVLHEAVAKLPIAKPMRWGDHDFAFVRPVHWLLLLFGTEPVECEVFGVRAGRTTRGHRFHHPQPVPLTAATDYLDALRQANVLADPSERRERVRAEVARGAAQSGGIPHLPPTLLEEITNLTEWPVAIGCTFSREFLAVPEEVLIETMQTQQRFVPLFGASGKLTEHFIGIANIASSDPARIRHGYERVIRPRFADAKFFFDEDAKTPLATHQAGLANVVYQQRLGSIWDKCVRVAELARGIANRVGVDAACAVRAAQLSRCDLLTRMVGEFPELQGVMGYYYAVASGEPDDVADAIRAMYQPRFSGDRIAARPLGRVLAVADRLDTLAGIFAVGLKPSGNKDPFALRRAALGLARTLLEGELDLDLEALFRDAVDLLPDAAFTAPPSAPAPSAERKTTLVGELLDFVYERLRGYYAERGHGGDRFDAVRAVKPATLPDFDRRLRALAEFVRQPEAQALAAANKRIGNLLRQASEPIGMEIETAALEAGAERALHEAITAAEAVVAPFAAERRYLEVLTRLAQLRGPVDAFFDHVLVMADEPAKRRNRLALLGRLRRMFLDIADISLLQGA
jgi:glycyl-tRNA synthetase beta chain